MAAPVINGPFKMLSGACPVDGATAHWLQLPESEPDMALLSGDFPFSVQVCPVCLTASADETFLAGGANGFGAALRRPQNILARSLAESLGARLALVKEHWSTMGPEERRNILMSKANRLQKTLSSFLREAVPGLDPQETHMLTSHFIGLFSTSPDPGEIFSQFTMRTRYPETVAGDSPAARLIATGAPAGDVAQALLFGALVSGFTPEIAADPESLAASSQGWQRLAALHLELDRLTTCLSFLAEQALSDSNAHRGIALSEPHRIVKTAEQILENSPSLDAGYYCLALGLNYQKEYALYKPPHISSRGHEDDLEYALRQSIKFLELSLQHEKYPHFAACETIETLNANGCANVPYPFGEFGVRHVLCWLYNELGRLKALSEYRDEHALREIKNRIISLWTANCARLRALRFHAGTMPGAAGVIAERTLEFCAACFDEKTGRALKKLAESGGAKLFHGHSRFKAKASTPVTRQVH